MSNSGTKEDIQVFADNCVFFRSVYLHFKGLYEESDAEDKARMTRSAPTLFGDLNHVLIEYVILQVCKITDAAKDIKKNDNHTVAFLIQHYGLTGHARLAEIDARMQAFRQKLLPARNKLISHADRDAILGGNTMGGAPSAEWDQFWSDLDELVNIVHLHVTGDAMNINGVSVLSDVDGLLKSLAGAEHFSEMLADKNKVVANRAAEIAWE